jgi:flagellar basal-body rod protein FlgC
MDSFGVFKVSSSAMAAQRERMNVIASNMANAHTTRTEEGGPYKKKDVVFSVSAIESNPAPLDGVAVAGVVADRSPFTMVHDPGHPDADADGFVAMPNVNVIEEMVNMMMAFRAYEASVSAFNTSKSMLLKTLELGKV